MNRRFKLSITAALILIAGCATTSTSTKKSASKQIPPAIDSTPDQWRGVIFRPTHIAGEPYNRDWSFRFEPRRKFSFYGRYVKMVGEYTQVPGDYVIGKPLAFIGEADFEIESNRPRATDQFVDPQFKLTFANLGQVRTYTWDGETLILYDLDGGELFRFRLA